ncbi:TetR/AcrR family transcriptional regulator [Agrobacterium rubi]|uniref:TetR/AcrR family transcriptional regulator n=1 Tax=Agrobacterium rubi TaxID=28099 RepID=A0AAE7UP65_9HYPH|nr:TetR/AcrR family transcriptional regulator [Agrobacterium rubi]MCL6652161.1 TetR family transcriptional regulator [Agrobacterium rubi]NTE89322.1 TetR/AcrR family transcriptional regulator [Agrobacterium rubi]NTF05104.1 TetR/AcrR family transcriptional regulator [Agrobacterium rubi]NTF09193.1 TetR/AcrR family transcriptional regulator [Agrobacterium rubi]NTF22102.1 TetR/AcrR family transcriptional regulator [Agrobacterium rubi]
MKSEKSGLLSEQKIPPRDRIVSTACQLFREHGIRGIGVDAIAEAASTNKMTLYRHFGSKDDLVCEALKHSSQALDKAWEYLEAENPGDPKAQLAAWVKARAQCLASEPYGCDLANAAVELKEQEHPAHAIIETLKMQQHSRLADLCRSTGINDPDLLADTLAMLLEGARVSKLATGDEGPSMRFTRACEATMASFGLGPTACP